MVLTQTKEDNLKVRTKKRVQRCRQKNTKRIYNDMSPDGVRVYNNDGTFVVP